MDIVSKITAVVSFAFGYTLTLAGLMILIDSFTQEGLSSWASAGASLVMLTTGCLLLIVGYLAKLVSLVMDRPSSSSSVQTGAWPSEVFQRR